ncbi:Hsp20/alpha crystallin family protein [Mycolicibacterium celeriflavum]|uniref:Hsp20/alpha crystallin family protein n=1 Tax=Mycolicibacterium celeriflavum TaxID=1249101 RepID=UPI001A96F140|nr:Hsp20/alpha crystallin family protein [Mycolicibacterium celeriflavum]
MTMLKFDPFVRDVDRLTQQLWGATIAGPQPSAPLDAWRTGEAYVVEFDLPGIDADSLDVNVDNNVLTVRAERPEPADTRNWQVAERPHGVFSRQLSLGNNVDVEKISADYRDGVLRLTIPVSETAKPRKVAVVAGQQKAAINA